MTSSPRSTRSPFLLAALVAALCAVLLAGTPATQAAPRATAVPAAVAPQAAAAPQFASWTYGTSVEGRPLVAYRMGNWDAEFTAVVVIGMHGNERAVGPIYPGLRDLAAAGRFSAVNLWVVPSYNPDGLLRRDRQNARGVDLNRNFDNDWRRLTGNYYSGTRPVSEPETAGAVRMLSRIQPDVILSFHQPLNGVDLDTKFPSFARATAQTLDLPGKRFTCGGVCHGTMTGWYNNNYPGVALTVEYGTNPDATYMRTHASRRIAALLQRSAGSA
ncbi:M14 family zinc carboxypeptidase [Nocardioides sp. CPCC 205120]|uniref:M14 family zinc carboxypeptidase n=1 Tax=Nocardioides sp. CPCC 205120 TaxID=3406462 RepID=UPI003B512134